jgi:hypothetical protein
METHGTNQTLWWWKHVLPKRRFIPTRLHGVTNRKTKIRGTESVMQLASFLHPFDGMCPPNFAASFKQKANDLTFSLTTILRGTTTNTRRQFPAHANKLVTLPSYCQESLFSFRVELLFCFTYYLYFSSLEVSTNKHFSQYTRDLCCGTARLISSNYFGVFQLSVIWSF